MGSECKSISVFQLYEAKKSKNLNIEDFILIFRPINKKYYAKYLWNVLFYNIYSMKIS